MEQTDLIYPDWQQYDVTRLLSQEGDDAYCQGNWSEMGCFKTSTGLRIVSDTLKNDRNPQVLIVTTRSGKGAFIELIPLLCPEYDIYVVEAQRVLQIVDGLAVPAGRRVSSTTAKRSAARRPAIYLAHYHLFSRPPKGNQHEAILDHHWDYVWLDEAHRIKDRNTVWTKRIKKVALPLPMERRHISTGTGFVNRPDEIWSLLNFLDRKTFSSWYGFRDRYCLIDDWNGWEVVVGVKPEMLDEFRALVRKYGVRRTLDEVMPTIKQAIHVEHTVDLSPIQRRMYDTIKAELRVLDCNGAEFHSPNVLTLLSRLRQISVATPEVVSDEYDPKRDRRIQEIRLTEPSAKLDTLFEIIDGLPWKSNGDSQPVVIFSNFVGTLELLAERIRIANAHAEAKGLERPYPTIWMKASHDDTTRHHLWGTLFPTGDYRIFMSTLQLGSESINLTPARYCIFIDRSFSPIHNMQGVGRVRRPGQTGEPVIININSRKTVDQYIETKLIKKQGWFDSVFGEGENEL